MALAEAPMSIGYDKLVPALKTLLPDEALNALGRAVAFIRRLREVQADLFIWAVVLSRFGTGRPAFEQARQWYRRLGGAELWPRPFQMRFKSPATVRLFERAFDNAVKPWRSGPRARHPLAKRFSDIAVVDCTTLPLDDALRPTFRGAGGSMAALKLLLTVSVFGLVPLHAQMLAAHNHDQKLFPPLRLFREGTLFLFDKGFVAYTRLREIRAAAQFYLCRMRLNGNALVVAAHQAPAHVHAALRRHPGGVMLRDLLAAEKRIVKTWDLDVLLSKAYGGRRENFLPSRLVIVSGPKQEQRPYFTNLSREEWSPSALVEIYRLRWQVELVFKELKQHLNLESLNSKDPHAVQVFVWASLIALAVSRTVTAWVHPHIVGLSSGFRPALTSRSMRATVRFLARALVAPLRRSLEYLKDFAEELLLEIRSRDKQREDSFARLLPLIFAS
jgi:hypothetical protein